MQGIICCFWRAVERKGGAGWWMKGGMDGYNGWMDGWMGGWVDGWVDGWVSRWPGGQDEFTQSHIPHFCKISTKVSSAGRSHPHLDSRPGERRVDGGK